MNLSEETTTTLLLCGVFGANEESAAPLTTRELNRLAAWLEEHGFNLADLTAGAALEELRRNLPADIDLPRLERLLARGAEVAFAVERWTNKGAWILTRNEINYPALLKSRLGIKAPPILYGFGDLSLLESGGLAIVGSRSADREALEFTAEVARAAAIEGMTIISGGARGVDRMALETALDTLGKAVGVLADSLLKTALHLKFRKALLAQRLTLLSPYHPEAGFNVGNAMGRNKLIYALSHYALVVSTEFEKGGTWAGANEELKRDEPLPVFVHISRKTPRGNTELLKLGARPFPEKPWVVPLGQLLSETVEQTVPETGAPVGVINFASILPRLLVELETPRTTAELVKSLGVEKKQMNEWLKEAVNRGILKKQIKPVRYVKISTPGEELMLKL
jgi:predicted Rossmann fold nucleotide-binding protein DprA/Smf involved in DNA uptake